MKQIIKKITIFISFGTILLLFMYFIFHPDLAITYFMNQQKMVIYLIVTILLNVLFISALIAVLHFIDKIFGKNESDEEVIPYTLFIPMILYLLVFFYARSYFASIPVALLGLQAFRLNKYINIKKSLVSTTKLRLNLVFRIILNLWVLATLIEIIQTF